MTSPCVPQAEGLRQPPLTQLLRSSEAPPEAPINAPSQLAAHHLPQEQQTAQPAGLDHTDAQPAARHGSSPAAVAALTAVAPPDGQCAVSMRLGSGWQQGEDFAVDVNLAITNTGACPEPARAVLAHLVVV